MLDPRTSFRSQFAKINGLQREKAQLAGFVLRQEFLLTHDTEIAHEHLRPYGALPAVLFRLRSEEHTSTPVTNAQLVCRLLLEKKNISNLTRTDPNKTQRQ